MKKSIYLLVTLAFLAGVIATFYYERHRPGDEQPVVQNGTTPLPEQGEGPPIQYPISQDADHTAPAPDQPPPSLNESDAALQAALGSLYDPQKLGDLLIFKDLIRHIVVTIDNLPQGKLPDKYMPTKPPPGSFLARPDNAGSEVIAADNYRRYARYVQLAEAIDTQKLVAVYARFYPLFQAAYVELGYPKRYFNDRLVEVIDHLLETPEIQAPIRLVRPSVSYKFADPALEGRSAGQKILIRMGKDNAARLKVKLREQRNELTKLGRTRQP